jgi:hypothetical protein
VYSTIVLDLESGMRPLKKSGIRDKFLKKSGIRDEKKSGIKDEKKKKKKIRDEASRISGIREENP